MKRILVCLDTSPRAPHVLATAIDLARRTGARLTLFRSVGLPPDIAHQDIIGVSPSAIADRMLEAAKVELARYRDEHGSELIDAVEAKIGTPWDAICHEADTIEADLIILGSHGFHALDRLLGTTSSKVLNHAHCSVMVVR